MVRTSPGEFRGTSRFEVTGQLGEGGMGIVYRALDRERGAEVALKTLTNVSAAAIFRFKQEFRALADVAHPNLVTLHELFCEDHRWFFTMELIDGVDLLTYVCGRTTVDRPLPTQDTIDLRRDQVDIIDASPRGRPLVSRLRQALPQLVRGLVALHDSGHLHHDVKPSNVMVTLDGRVVLLDFGVIAAHGTRDSAGTPAYMAPEQVKEEPATPASDWYSVGVILYHALAGHLPFTGSPQQMMWDKVHAAPAPIRLARPETPEDLDELCADLLRIEPAERPTGRDILARLGSAERRGARVTGPRFLHRDDPELVGRDPHLRALDDALARSRHGGTVALVHGISGMGKSALVRTFVDQARRDAGALVFAGRCYERESVPYKAIDTVIDALCEHLLALPEAELARVLPGDAALVATLFPVLRRVHAIAELAVPDLSRRPERLRRRAFEALREIFARLAARGPVIVAIDDLQWGDADSAPLLEALVRAPNAPAILLLGCYRSDETNRSPLLRAWMQASDANVVRIAVDALVPDEAAEIARAAFRAAGVSEKLAGAVALESAGNPFFLHELVHYAATAPEAQLPSLAAVIGWRIDQLGEDARRLIEVLAVASRPIEQRVARAVADITEIDWPILIQRVGAARVVRVSGRRGDDLVECYHDRIRESVQGELAAPRIAELHGALATALLQDAHCDPEVVAHHLEAAGDRALAGQYTLQAAELAAAALAFDRAVVLYRRAIELRPETASAIRLRLAGALVNAGRGADAAPLYLEAASDAEPGHDLELRRLAAEQLLRSGHVDHGLVALEQVLRAVGMSLPATAGRSIPSLLWRRLRLRMRGLEPAPERTTSADLATRLDVARTATLGLALFDPARSATFSTQHLRLSLESGDLFHVSFALAIEAGYTASARDPQRAIELLRRAEVIANEVGHPMLHGCVGMIRAIVSYERGDFRDAFDGCERAEVLIRDHLTGTAWELRTLQLFALHSLFFLGELTELVRRTRLYIDDARDRGDLYATLNMRSLAGNAAHVIVHDDPATSYAELQDVASQLPSSGFYLQHMFVIYTRTMLDLYTGEAERAYRNIMTELPKIKRSLLLYDRGVRAFWTFLRSNAALAIAERDHGRRRELLGVAARGARVLERDGAIPYVAMAHQLRAAIAHQRGNDEAAAGELASSASAYERANMKVFAGLARRRLGALLGGERGAEIIRAQEAQLRGDGCGSPERCSRCLTAGFD